MGGIILYVGGAFDFEGKAGNSYEYSYNGNGQLARDANRGISRIEYDLLGNPRKVSMASGDYIKYVYAPDGTKLKTSHYTRRSGSGTPSHYCRNTYYRGNMIYHYGSERIPSMILFPGGYYFYESADDMMIKSYYVKDYQGNNRMVVHHVMGSEFNGQTTHYYPFGGVIGDISTSQGLQPYMHSGKELDRTYGLDLYDFHARQQDPVIGRFTSPDPKSEDYYHVSPYAYCAGDPVNNVDPTGMTIVADSLAQIAMINSLPENERTLLHFDNNGNLTVNQAEKPSEVLADILKLVESNTIYNLYVSATDMNGTPFRNDQSNYYKGYTQTPTDPNYPSQEGNVHVYMSSLLKGIELPLNFGHEVLSHALFYEMGLPFGHDYEYQPIKKFYKDEGVWGYELKRVDKNTELNLQINRIQKIIKQNYNGQK